MPRSLIRHSGPAGATRARGRTITSGQHLLQRIRRLRSVACLTSVVLLVFGSTRLVAGPVTHPIGPVIGATGIILLALCESYRGIAAHIRAEDRRTAELADAARRDGVSLAANTLQHQIGNKLAVTVGFGEMLLDDPRLPPDLRASAHKLLGSAMAAAEIVHKLDAQLTRIEVDHSVTGAEVLDVDASTRIDDD